jgi:hypothetical protein
VGIKEVPATMEYTCDACGFVESEEDVDLVMHSPATHPLPATWAQYVVLTFVKDLPKDKQLTCAHYCPKCAEKIDRAIRLERAKISEMNG